MIEQTIAAIATPSGNGGIGIIKISGPLSKEIARRLFIPNRSAPIDFRSHRLYYGHIIDSVRGEPIDEVLLTVMHAPNTYTREDVVEINAHAGSTVLERIMEEVLKNGARIAEPGEFTKRAFLNGRIDLTQAEAVIDIISAKTEMGLKSAAAQLNGEMSDRVNVIRNDLIQVLTEIEAAIDFPDDLYDSPDTSGIKSKLNTHGILPLTRLIHAYDNAHIYRDGARLIIVGRPNVGKSSLMNRLLEKERVIVTDIPGTTRDVVEDSVNISGVPVILADSAGLHESTDPVEIIGMAKTKEHVERSHKVLMMLDADEGITSGDHAVYQRISQLEPILVVNKVDLMASGFKIALPDSWKVAHTVYVSALFGTGMETIRSAIKKELIGERDVNDIGIIPRLRHKKAFEHAIENLEQAIATLDDNGLFELIKIDLSAAIHTLGSVVGFSADPDILDEIFSQFCIGK